ncbi:hypothetical protein [Brachyspira sp. G79]|uniref:hypothetical protein n=1 Tax=Brachyspira sp. G79 TaxID=1358104 RepID=UPI000BBB7972|nr:hypothetical protein [Brachyspira sp. G79]PCG20252.1 hypothetical protein KQ44_09665 [Brachyspira sp. G79]
MKILKIYAILQCGKKSSFGSRLREIKIEKDSIFELENAIKLQFDNLSNSFNEDFDFKDKYSYNLENNQIFYIDDPYFNDINEIFINNANIKELDINSIKLERIKSFSFFC